MNTVDTTTLDQGVLKVMKALRSVESGDGKGGGGNYNAVGDNGSSTGAFQWNNGKTPVAKGGIPINYQSDARTYGVDPNDFSPAAQNQVMYRKILAQKNAGLGPEEIAALHNGASKDPSTGKYVYNNPDYGVKFRTALQGLSTNVLSNSSTSNNTVPNNDPNADFRKVVANTPMTPDQSGMVNGVDTVPLTNVASIITDPVEKMGLGVANTVNPSLGREQITSLPGITGENVQAPGYDTQGNWQGMPAAIGQFSGAAIQTGANLATGGESGALMKMIPSLGKATGVVGNIAREAITQAPVGATMMGGQAMSEGKSPIDVAKATGEGALGAGLLGGVSAAVSGLATKLSGVNANMIDEVSNLRRAGKTAEADALEKTPEYQQVLKANGVDDKSLDTTISNLDSELKRYEDEGIGRSRGVAQGRRNTQQSKIQAEQRAAWMENMRTPDSVENPFQATQANIENNRQIIGNNTADVIDAARASKADILPMDTKSITKQVEKDLYDSGVQGTEYERAIKAFKQDMADREAQAARQGRKLDIADFYNMKQSANSSFGGESFGAKLDNSVGNVLRNVLDNGAKNAPDDVSKSIISHLRQSDAAYSKLKQAEEYNKFLQSFPGGKPSKVINLMAGYGLGGGPVGGMAMMFLTDKLQQRIINTRSNRILNGLVGKVKGMTTDDLIGDAQKTINKIKGLGEAKVANEQAVKYNSDREKAVNKLMETLRPKTDAELPVIQMGPKAKSKYNKADSSLPTIHMRGLSTPESLAALGGIGATGIAAYDKMKADSTYTADQPTPEEPFLKPIVNEQGIIDQKKGLIDGIDISKYATDPQHEVKVRNIYDKLPPVATSSEAQNYIDHLKKDYGHQIKVTGDMVYNAAKEYGVSMKLMLALMQNDSMFGTTGKGRYSHNPGNIGNNDKGDMIYYPTWAEGVRAVARQIAKYKPDATPEVLSATGKGKVVKAK